MVLRKVISIVLCLGLFFSKLYLLWMTTPLYALRDAAFAAYQYDRENFERRVDIDGFIDDLLADLILRPAESTPGLTSFQVQVSRGAIALVVNGLARDLKSAVRRSVTVGNLDLPERRSPQPGRVWTGIELLPIFAPAMAASPAVRPDDVKTLLNVASRAAGSSAERLKRVAHDRMWTYIYKHPETLPGRLLGCHPSQRQEKLRLLLNEYGLTRENFRGLSSCKIFSDDRGGEIARVGFSFFSPKLNGEFVIKLELAKSGMFGDWRLMRIANVPDIFEQLGLDYYDQIHNLMRYSLAGLSNESVNAEMQGVTEQIKQSDAAKNILQKWKINLK